MTGHCLDTAFTLLEAADSFSKSSNTPAISQPIVNMNSVAEQLSVSQRGFYNGINYLQLKERQNYRKLANNATNVWSFFFQTLTECY